MNRYEKRRFGGFCILQGTYWSFYASFIGYITSYLLARGMSNTHLSWIVSAYMLTSFAGLMFWGRMSDRLRTNKNIFLLGNAAAAFLGVLVFSFAGSTAAVAVLYPLFGFMVVPLATMLDSWIMQSFPQKADAFGQSRSFASGSYAVVMLMIGQLIARLGFRIMLAATLFFLTVTVANALTLPDVAKEKIMKEKKSSVAEYRLLAGIRPYRVLLAVLFLTGLCLAPVNNMKIVIMQSVGGNVASVGLDSFIGCMMQLPFLVGAGKLIRIPAKKRLVMVAGAQVIMAALTMLATSPAMVIMGSIFNNIGVGIILPTMREIAQNEVPEHLRNTAHSLADAAYNSVSAMLALTYAGAVSDLFSVRAMVAVSLSVETAALLLAVRNARETTREEWKMA